MNPGTNHSQPPISEWVSKTLHDGIINTISSPGDSNPEPNAERPKLGRDELQKLIDGALYSEKIINTYPWVILGIVLVISAVHWAEQLIRWRGRAAWRAGERYSYNILDDEPSKIFPGDITDHSSIGSSGSSTYASNTPSIKLNTEDEHTPLLHNHYPKSVPWNRSTVISSIKAFLIYQPRPIPYFNKALPSNGSSIFLLSFLALNLFYTFYNIPFTLFEASVLGDRAGLVFAINLPLLYILGAKNQPLKVLTGVSYESLNIIHRRLGELLMFEALIHASGMFVMWYTILKPYSGWSLLEFLTHRIIYLGLMAFVTYKLLYVTSLASFRQRWYELFLGLHVVLQAAALIILYFHHRGAKAYVKSALLIFLVDRLVYRLFAKSIMAEGNIRIFPDNSTILLTFHFPKTPTPSSPKPSATPSPPAGAQPTTSSSPSPLRPYPHPTSPPLHHRLSRSPPLFPNLHPLPPNPSPRRFLR